MKNIVSLVTFFVFSIGFSQVENRMLNTTNIPFFTVDKKATNETLSLFYNLKQLSKTGFAIGQQDAFNSFYFNIKGKSDISKTTGSEPAIIGLDFSFITDDKNTGQTDNWYYQQEQKTIADAKKAYNQGIIISFCWHFREPYKGEEFYAEKMSDTQKKSVESILPNGENHEYYKKKLDKIASVAKKMIGKDGKLIPVIFRPFHEFDGNWFWWGENYCTAEQYKHLYIFTVQYLRDFKEVHNFLYAFSPDNHFITTEDYLKRYPGDAYVDVLGMDDYGDFDNKGIQGIESANTKLKILSDLSKQRNKIAAMTETGYEIKPKKPPIDDFFSKNMYNALTNNSIEIAYVLFWANSGNGYYIPQPNMPDTTDFIEFTNKPKSKLLNNLPKMYKLNKN